MGLLPQGPLNRPQKQGHGQHLHGSGVGNEDEISQRHNGECPSLSQQLSVYETAKT